MPFRRIRDRGIPVCLGTDEAIADDAVNMWGVAKMAGLIHNITGPDPEAWPRATEVLDCLLRGGARAMGLADHLGVVEPGRFADLVLLDLDTLPFTPLNDLHRQLVYCENGGSVVLTMVAGRIVFEAGQVTTVDEPALRSEARALFERRADLEAARRGADRWLPAYRAMVGERFPRAMSASSAGSARPKDRTDDCQPRPLPLLRHYGATELEMAERGRASRSTSRSASRTTRSVRGGPRRSCPGRRRPDFVNTAWRDYGNRVRRVSPVEPACELRHPARRGCSTPPSTIRRRH